MDEQAPAGVERDQDSFEAIPSLRIADDPEARRLIADLECAALELWEAGEREFDATPGDKPPGAWLRRLSPLQGRYAAQFHAWPLVFAGQSGPEIRLAGYDEPANVPHRASIAELQQAADAHHLAPAEFAPYRTEMARFLTGGMAAWKADSWPEVRKAELRAHAWGKLRQRIADTPRFLDGEEIVYAVYDEINKAQRSCEEDRKDATIVTALRRKYRARLRAVTRLLRLGPALRRAAASLPRPYRDRFMDQPLDWMAVDTDWGPRFSPVTVSAVLDPSRLNPGGGRARRHEHGLHSLMRFFTGAVGLGTQPAAFVTSDLLCWFAGQMIAPDAVKKDWQRYGTRDQP